MEGAAERAAALHLRMRRCGGGGGGGRAICVRSVIVTHPLNRHIMPLREREKEGRGGGRREGRSAGCGGGGGGEEAERKQRCAIATVQFHS